MIDGEGSVLVHFGTADVQELFIEWVSPCGFSRYFGMPAVRAGVGRQSSPTARI